MREPPFRGTAPRTAVHSVGRTARADLAAPARADLAAVNVLKTRAPGGPGAPSRTEGPQGSPRQTLVDVWDHITDGEYGGPGRPRQDGFSAAAVVFLAVALAVLADVLVVLVVLAVFLRVVRFLTGPLARFSASSS